MSHRALARSLSRAAAQANEAAVHSAVTITARLPVLAGHLMTPSAAGLAEWNRAYAEKVAATVEGSLAAALAWQAACWRACLRPPSPIAFANDVMQVMHKAGHPARRRVKANARRLSQPAQRT